MEWHPFYYKGQETNIEVNKLGNVRRVPKDWMKNKHTKCTLRTSKGYYVVPVGIRSNIDSKYGRITKDIKLHQIMAIVFLDHIPNGYEKVIDHIDKNPLNNKIENLRIVTPRENSTNRKDASQYGTGVIKKIECNKIYFRSTINVKGKSKYLGSYNTPEEASAAYQEALRKINAGEFATN